MSTLNFCKIDCFIRAEVMNKEALYNKNYKTTFVIIDCEVDFFGKQLPNQCLRRSAKLTHHDSFTNIVLHYLKKLQLFVGFSILQGGQWRS